jgi:hypothetical protein
MDAHEYDLKVFFAIQYIYFDTVGQIVEDSFIYFCNVIFLPGKSHLSQQSA